MLFAIASDLAAWLDDAIVWFNQLFPADTPLNHSFWARALFAVILVGFLCGALGSIVVSSRMAFFSDALSHCAFAGVALGLLIGIVLGVFDEDFRHWITTIMVAFGLLIGLLIGYVRERTGLSSDTVIGVFFAVAVGLGGMFQRAARGRNFFNLEKFIFGDPVTVLSLDIVWLIFLIIPTALFLYFFYNPLVFGSFNPSLARSRQLPYRQANYLFIGLLALLINLSVQFMGVLLISGLLIVPAATASLISRNMRQFFWYSVGLSLFSCVIGLILVAQIQIHDPRHPQMPIQFGIAGTIVVFSGLVFAVTMFATGKRYRLRG